MFERIVARLQSAEPGSWVLKGGMALEVRLSDDARLTKDIDLGLRDEVEDGEALHDRLVEVLSRDADGDGFELQVSVPETLSADGGGHVTWRAKVAVRLAGKPFGGIQIDVSPRAHELLATDRLPLSNSLEFAGVPTTTIEIIDVHRHAAEKYHAMFRDYGERDNSRFRDLVDLVILIEHQELTASLVAQAAMEVWSERDGTTPPRAVPSLPVAWPDRYEQSADEHELDARSFDDAVALVQNLWSETFPSQESKST
jgi:predicted nucleotidyltransferase component of viral defense system